MSERKRDIATDYLNGAAELRPFYGQALAELDWGKAIATKSAQPINRKVLVESLLEQYKGIDPNRAVIANIEALASPNTFTVTTGHQLVLHGGPMFTLYKIATTIRMAEELATQFPDFRFVPVFWMATEDHDFAEANHYFPTWCEKIEWKTEWAGAVGRAQIDGAFFSTIPPSFPEFAAFYPEGAPYAQGYRAFIHHIFGDKGLVVLDADLPALKREFLPVMREEILKQSAFQAVSAANERLEMAGYNVQVHPREVNLFYLTESTRERIAYHADSFSVVDGEKTWQPAEILDEMETHPERFSPNVVLRPLFQEMILPNLAYTGGWGELSYWMQLKGVFEGNQTPFPVLIPRFTAVLYTSDQAARIQTWGLNPQDMALEMPKLYDKVLPKFWSEGPFRALEQKLLGEYDGMAQLLAEMDPTLAKSFAADQARARKRLDRMHGKIKKSVRNKHGKAFRDLEELKAEIQPTGQVQERILHFSAFDIPLSQLLELIYDHCQPFTRFERQWIQLP